MVSTQTPADQETEVVPLAEESEEMPLPSDPKVIFLGGLFVLALLATAYVASEIDLTFERGRAWRVAKPLNSSAMHAAAQRLVGRHDFTSFRHAECQAKSPLKTLDALDVHRLKDDIHI